MREFRPCPKPLPREKKQPKPIPKRSKKKQDEIRLSEKYYQEAIQANIKRQTESKNNSQLPKVCICDECSKEIINPSGSNVCHIIGMGANKKLYYEPTNHFILCQKCADIEQNGNRKSMKIFPEWEKRRLQLLQSIIPSHRK